MSKEIKQSCRRFLRTVGVSIVFFATINLAPLFFPAGTIIHTASKDLTTMTDYTPFGTSASAQSARDIIGPSPLIEIKNEAPPKLIVDRPLPKPLAQGRVFIQYRAENLRVLPVFGEGALQVRHASVMSTSPLTTRRGILPMPVVKRSSWLDWNLVHTRC
jgi:hypothetical protein